MWKIPPIEEYMPGKKTLAQSFKDFKAIPRETEAVLSAWSLLEEVLEIWFRQLLLDRDIVKCCG